jgi:hypothetical protein
MAEWLLLSRSPEGRESLRADGHLSALLSEHSSSNDWQRKHQIVQCFRNCLISCELNGLYLLEGGFLHQLVQHLHLLEEMKEQEIATKYCVTALQFLANFVTCHEACASAFWNDFGPETISRLISLSISLKSDLAVAATVAVLHSCTSKDGPAAKKRKDQFLAG